MCGSGVHLKIASDVDRDGPVLQRLWGLICYELHSAISGNFHADNYTARAGIYTPGRGDYIPLAGCSRGREAGAEGEPPRGSEEAVKRQ